MKITIEDRTGKLGEFTVPDEMVESGLSKDNNITVSFGGWDEDKEHFCRGRVKLDPLAFEETDRESEIDHGGNAFPCAVGDCDALYDGMTMRQYYAAKAMKICPINVYEFDECAEWCFQYADAMIRAEGE